jgi:hypothetical protein
MGSPVTITPDPQQNSPVTITPDAPKEEKPKENPLVRFARNFDQTVLGTDNPSDVLHGIGLALSHPHLLSDSLKEMAKGAVKSQQDAIDSAYDFQHRPGILNKAEGVARGVSAAIPIVGPAMLHAGDQVASGDVAGGLGTATGVVAPAVIAHPAVQGAAADLGAAIKKPIQAGAQGVAQRMYQSALKPSTTMEPWQRTSAIKTGLNADIPVSEGGLEKLNTLVSGLNSEIDNVIASKPGATINKFAVTRRLGDVSNRFGNQVAPSSDLAKVADVGNDFLDTKPGRIPAAQAQEIKKGTYQTIGSRAYGEVKAAQIESEKALARGIKEELETQFPEIKGLNQQESNFLGLEPSLQRALGRNSNHQMLGIGTPIAAGGAAAATGSSKFGAVVGTIKAVVDNPIVKSKLAIAINKASKGSISLPAARAKVAAYSTALAGSLGQMENQDGDASQQ